MRTRRHFGPWSLEALRATAWRGFLRDVGLIAIVAILGFALTSSWISPGTMLTSDHAVPRVLGLPEAEARRTLANLGLRPRLDGDRESPDIPRGAVLWQDPPPEMVVPPGTSVQLVLSAGPAPVTVPDVVGLAQPYAEKIFEAAGIEVGSVDTVSGRGEAGVVLATRPPSGHGRSRGTTVDLVVSGAPGDGL